MLIQPVALLVEPCHTSFGMAIPKGQPLATNNGLNYHPIIRLEAIASRNKENNRKKGLIPLVETAFRKLDGIQQRAGARRAAA